MHNIASNTFESALPAQSHRRARERSRTRFIGPPQDAIELGERIWTFWELVLLNYGGDYSFDFEPSWKKEEIRTPFPMPMLAYEPVSTGFGNQLAQRSCEADFWKISIRTDFGYRDGRHFLD